MKKAALSVAVVTAVAVAAFVITRQQEAIEPAPPHELPAVAVPGDGEVPQADLPASAAAPVALAPSAAVLADPSPLSLVPSFDQPVYAEPRRRDSRSEEALLARSRDIEARMFEDEKFVAMRAATALDPLAFPATVDALARQSRHDPQLAELARLLREQLAVQLAADGIDVRIDRHECGTRVCVAQFSAADPDLRFEMPGYTNIVSVLPGPDGQPVVRVIYTINPDAPIDTGFGKSGLVRTQNA